MKAPPRDTPGNASTNADPSFVSAEGAENVDKALPPSKVVEFVPQVQDVNLKGHSRKRLDKRRPFIRLCREGGQCRLLSKEGPLLMTRIAVIKALLIARIAEPGMMVAPPLDTPGIASTNSDPSF